MMDEQELKILKDLVDIMEENDEEWVKEHDLFTDHGAEECALCAARNLLHEYKEKAEKKAKRKLKVFYRGFSSDGIISLSLNDVDYSYRVDSARIPYWVKILTGKRPGSVVKEIKETCHWYRNDTTGELVIHTGKKTYYHNNKKGGD